ncbi:hypothetical protein J3F83DRAFT_741719 [Trichoderma novae-zelandiae]
MGKTLVLQLKLKLALVIDAASASVCGWKTMAQRQRRSRRRLGQVDDQGPGGRSKHEAHREGQLAQRPRAGIPSRLAISRYKAVSTRSRVYHLPHRVP